MGYPCIYSYINMHNLHINNKYFLRNWFGAIFLKVFFTRQKKVLTGTDMFSVVKIFVKKDQFTFFPNKAQNSSRRKCESL
jgi:hypothetical protein